MPRGIKRFKTKFDEDNFLRREDSVCVRNNSNLTISLRRAMGNWDLERLTAPGTCQQCGKPTWQKYTFGKNKNKPINANFCSVECYRNYREKNYKGIQKDINDEEFDE